MADRSVVYRLKAELGDFNAKMTQASASVKKTANDMTGASAEAAKFRGGLTTLGDAAGKVGIVAAAGLGLAVKAAMDWETAWTGVLKTVDGTPAELAKLETGLRDLAVETGFAHAEVAAVAEAAGQLGVSVGGIESFTKTMLNMGVSTNLSAEEAAVGFARLGNVMGTTEADVGNTGAAIVGLGNSFATTEAEILAMSMRLAGAARQAGLSTADVLGLSAAMSEVGIEAEAGGSAMSVTMKRIEKSVDDGGSSLELFAKTAGMSSEDFAAAWGDDASGTLTAFIGGLDKAKESGASVNGILRELGITGIREADALLRLSGNAERVGEAFAQSNNDFEANLALIQESDKFYDTSAQQVAQSWAQIKDSTIDAGAAMLPVVEGVAAAVGGMANAFQGLPGPVKGAVGPMLGITAILGGGLWFTAKAVAGVTAMRGAMTALSASSTTAAASLSLASKAALGLGAVGIGAVVGYQIAQAWRESAAELDRYIQLTRAGGGSDVDSQLDALKEQLAVQQAIKDEAIGFEAFGAYVAPFDFGGEDSAVDAHNRIQVLTESIAELEHQKELDAIASENAAGATDAFGDAAAGTEGDVAALAEEAALLAEATKAAANAALSAFDAETSWRESLKAARQEVNKNSAGIRGNSDAAITNRGVLSDLAGAWNNQSDATKNATGKAKAARAAFIETAEGMGITKERARELANELLDIPKKVDTKVELEGIGAAQGALSGYDAALTNATRDRTTTVTTRYVNDAPIQLPPRRNINQADGGLIDFYADGGMRENHVAQIAPAGAWRVWAEDETGGEAYIPLSPAKRDRSISIWEETGRRLGVMYADGAINAARASAVPAGARSSGTTMVDVGLSDADISRLAEAIYDASFDGTALRETNRAVAARTRGRLGG